LSNKQTIETHFFFSHLALIFVCMEGVGEEVFLGLFAFFAAIACLAYFIVQSLNNAEQHQGQGDAVNNGKSFFI